MSWEQLAEILRENRDRRAAEDAAPPEACPTCGEPLKNAPDGGLFCPFAGDHSYRWP